MPAGQPGAEGVEGRLAGPQPAGHVRGDVHDVRIPLDLHHVGELHRLVVGDAADVVASQVDQHDVLGALLGVGQQLLGQRAVLGLVAPRGAACPASGRIVTMPVLDPHQDLGRAADQGEIAERQVEEERAGIDDPQHAVDVERLGAWSRPRTAGWGRPGRCRRP